MKNVSIILLLAVLFASCEKETESLQLPPAESMEMNFSAFVSEKSASMSEIDTKFNYNYSKVECRILAVSNFGDTCRTGCFV
jgi:hypothetical protein